MIRGLSTRWFWRLKLRTRLMAIGVFGLTVALLVAGFALYFGLRYAIGRNIDNQARADAGQVVALINGNSLPDPIPISGALVVQVLDAQHRVVAASAAADRLTPLLNDEELSDTAAGRALTVSGSRAGVAGPLRVVSETAGPANAPSTVIAAVSASDADHAAELVRDAALILFPLLLLILAAFAWRVIGRALQPVEALRSAAARISGTDADEELPVPVARDEISALAVTLNQMLARLSQARNRQRSFVSDAAHELRSPVASMQMQLEIAERGADPRPAAILAADVLIDLQRLTTIVEDLLTLAKSDAGDVPVRSVPTDVRELTLHYVDRVEQSADVTLEVRPGPAVQMHTDPDKLGRAFRNLLENALRYAKSRVIVDVSAGPSLLLISVVDDGPGIPVADRDRVFERFTRLTEARDRESGGAGLGLAIAAELVAHLEGTITLSDGPNGRGLRAELRCPRDRTGGLGRVTPSIAPAKREGGQ